MDRRTFLQGAAGAGLALATTPTFANSPNERISVCVMGVHGRGNTLLKTFAAMEDVEIAYVCDVDAGVLRSRVKSLTDTTAHRPKSIKDYREALEDPAVDALVIGAPEHWHAIPTIHACMAGKDVYVEKPDAHNAIEGEAMVAAGRKHGRVIQLGTQGRSGAAQQAAMDYIAAGNLGTVRFAKAWESAHQGSIGHPADSEAPADVDYDLWLGPAPKRPFNIRRFHGSWRWFFDYGTGDLGNDGVHLLDMARWGLASALKAEGKTLPLIPTAVSAHGGKHYFDDDQQWPDNLMVTYDFPDCLMTYEMRLWTPYPMLDEVEGVAIFGDKGYVTVGHRFWRAFDAKGKLLSEQKGEHNNVGHVRDFLDCMRTRGRPLADLETVGHPSSMLCHLGNAAWRTGHTIRFDAESRTCEGDEAASRFLGRAGYREPWTLPGYDSRHP